MSTKTTFKRVALVAVAALGFGMLSVVPSNAATVFAADNVTVVAPTSTTTINTAATTVVKLQGVCLGAYSVPGIANNDYSVQNNIGAWAVITQSVPDGITTYAAPTLTVQATSTAYPYLNAPTMIQAGGNDPAGVALQCSASGVQVGYATASFTPSAAGTYTFLIKGVFQAYAEAKWTVNVTAPTTASATAFINTSTGAAPTADTTSASRVASAAASATAAAIITVRQYSSTDTATAIVSGYASAVTATVAGAGILGTNINGSDRSSLGYSAVAGGSGTNSFYLFPDGRTGTSTVTITVGSTVITKTFTFYGSLSTYARSATDSPKTHIGIGETDVMNIVGKDSTGNLTNGAGSIGAKSSDSTIASVSVSNQAVTVTGVKSGTATISVCDTTSCISPTKSISITVNVAKTSAASFTLAFDKAEYTPGEKMTITVKAVDSNGAGVADGDRSLFSAAGITSNASLTGATWSASATVGLVAGVKTYTVYAPLVPGTVSIMATQGTAVDAVAAGGTAAVVSATAAVVTDGVAQAAADAAAEATDAANAATDAANAAAEAADAATAAAQDASDAVAALSTQVTTMIDALKKQITALTNLVIKIQKKVKA